MKDRAISLAAGLPEESFNFLFALRLSPQIYTIWKQSLASSVLLSPFVLSPFEKHNQFCKWVHTTVYNEDQPEDQHTDPDTEAADNSRRPSCLAWDETQDSASAHWSYYRGNGSVADWRRHILACAEMERDEEEAWSEHEADERAWAQEKKEEAYESESPRPLLTAGK